MDYKVGDIIHKIGDDEVLNNKEIITIKDNVYHVRYVTRTNIFTMTNGIVHKYYELLIPYYIPEEQHGRYRKIRNG